MLPRDFDKPMGLAVAPASDGAPARMALATREAIALFADAPALAPGPFPGRRSGYDAPFLSRVTYHTGDLHTHDLAFVGGELWSVNTRFSCLCRLSESFAFEPVWEPPS